MWFICIIILAVIVISQSCQNASEPYDPKHAQMEALFAKKFPSRTQKIKLTRAELCAKRGVNRVPKKDVMWNVYQWECAEYLSKELWIDYTSVKEEMAQQLFDEKKYRGALEQWLEVESLRTCVPYYLDDGTYPKQPFVSREALLGLYPVPTSFRSECTHIYFSYDFIECCEQLKLDKAKLKDIYFSIIMPAIPFPLSREEIWIRMEEQLDAQCVFDYE